MKDKEHQLFLDIVHDLEINGGQTFLDCRTIMIQDRDGAKVNLHQYEIIDGKLLLIVDQPKVTV